jgi:hypothetical protein
VSGEDFISRWSKRKIEARKAEAPQAQEETREARLETREIADRASAPEVSGTQAPAPLPPVESLTPESDFSPFMRPGVDADTRRLAVKKLFEDPRYNVMDGLDVYIDDYGKPDPLPEGWLEKMNQVARLGIFQPAATEEAPGEGAESAAAVEESPPETAQLPPAGAHPAPALPSVTSDDPVDASQVGESGPGKA